MTNIRKFGQNVWIQDKLSIGDDYSNLPRCAIDMSGKTDAIFVPKGTINQRPTSTTNDENGYLRYNSETNKFEGYEQLQWKNFITTNANMQFIPSYYVTTETEMDDAVSDINANYNGGNIYIVDSVTLTSNKTYDLVGINFYGPGRIIINSENGDVHNNSGYTITIVSGSTTWSDISFRGSDMNSSQNFSGYTSREIFKLGILGTDLGTSSPKNISFIRCSFVDIVGGDGSKKPIINLLSNVKTGAGYEISFDYCNYLSHDGSSSYPYDPIYEGFYISYSGAGCTSGNGGISISVKNFYLPHTNYNGTANLFGFTASNSICPDGRIRFNSDETAQITDSTWSSPDSLDRKNTFLDNPEKTSLLDSDYLFFNDSSGTNGKNNVKKITKSNLFINATNVSVSPDTAVLFANGTQISGSTNFTYNITKNSLQQGDSVVASGYFSQAKGFHTTAKGDYSYAGGIGNTHFDILSDGVAAFNHSYQSSTITQYGASGNYSAILGGTDNKVTTENSVVIGGNNNLASGLNSIVLGGQSNTASGDYSHAEGSSTSASGIDSHAEGNNTIALGDGSHAQGIYTTANSYAAYSGGYGNSSYKLLSQGNGTFNHSIQGSTTIQYGAYGNGSAILGGLDNKTVKDYSAVIGGNNNLASGLNSIVLGGESNTASGDYSYAEGSGNTASGLNSHAEGHKTEASGDYSHAEGYDTHATYSQSHAEGRSTTASEYYTHAEGSFTEASGRYSHAENRFTNASGLGSHAGGEGNATFKLKASGVAAFNHSYQQSTTTQYGASGNYSAILGGTDNKVTATNSAVIGGNTLSNTVANTVMVPAIVLGSTTQPSLPQEGTIYYNGTNFLGYTSNGWKQLDN